MEQLWLLMRNGESAKKHSGGICHNTSYSFGDKLYGSNPHAFTHTHEYTPAYALIHSWEHAQRSACKTCMLTWHLHISHWAAVMGTIRIQSHTCSWTPHKHLPFKAYVDTLKIKSSNVRAMKVTWVTTEHEIHLSSGSVSSSTLPKVLLGPKTQVFHHLD